MSRTRSAIPKISTTVRLSPEDFEWLSVRGRSRGALNDAVRELVRDARTCFGLPEAISERLAQDACGRELRDYVIEQLCRRYQELVRADLEAQKEATP